MCLFLWLSVLVSFSLWFEHSALIASNSNPSVRSDGNWRGGGLMACHRIWFYHYRRYANVFHNTWRKERKKQSRRTLNVQRLRCDSHPPIYVNVGYRLARTYTLQRLIGPNSTPNIVSITISLWAHERMIYIRYVYARVRMTHSINIAEDFISQISDFTLWNEQKHFALKTFNRHFCSNVHIT